MNEQNNQNSSEGQSGIDQETQLRNQENETGQQSDQEFSQQSQTSTEPTGSESDSGFVGSAGDQSSDYLTQGEKQDFQPEGQGASDSNSADADMTTGQPTSSDSTLDDGADTSR